MTQPQNCNSGKMIFRTKEDFTVMLQTSSFGTQHNCKTLLFTDFFFFFVVETQQAHTFSAEDNLPTLYVPHSQAHNTHHYYMKNSTELLFTAVQAGWWITQLFFCILHVSCFKLIHTSIIFIIGFDNNLSFSQVSNGKVTSGLHVGTTKICSI